MPATPRCLGLEADKYAGVANLNPDLLQALLKAATDATDDGVEFYGLCQIYRNEPWHYELRTDAIDRGRPRPGMWG
ncbi:hypothetical protein [Actinomadura rugatobispora]|uniref:Peptidase M15B domain-containing protein n=1 Tax=Actinomadura rugatobispora TaxID=1994 RepID=A0ABW1A1R8_9ACTN|nr:hypothetical protein GCM10010200_056610 [Actinomadura rugatobispora]